MKTISFWIRSLRIIPQVSKEEWQTLDLISRWLVASRSAVFIMTALSCMIGGILAFSYTGNFNLTNFVVCLFGLVFAHAANNLLNDLIDFRRDIDTDNYYRTLYGPQVIGAGYLSKSAFNWYITITLLLASLCGIILVLRTDLITLYLMATGVFFLYFYTWPLKYIGLGELTVLMVWGPLMVGGSYYVTSGGTWNWDVVYISLLYAIGPTSVIFGKHIDKMDKDKEKRVHTLPVLLGENLSRYITLVVLFLQLVLIIVSVYAGILGLPVLLVLLAVPEYLKTVRIFQKPKPSAPDPANPTTWPLYFASFAFVYNRRFSLLFLTGLLLSLFFAG